ncbi:hypothetical protein BDZ94DRAFT_1380969 [Collybia nuda]|uniref:Uncharacterized protein n=1 Tax=Collybia nuda TaxID=64659 RepID=A0A9P5Y1G2_9AGAR|nr:hypothetical protein BDZ94DRAFT_1380969 [Collybia nuda]
MCIATLRLTQQSTTKPSYNSTGQESCRPEPRSWMVWAMVPERLNWKRAWASFPHNPKMASPCANVLIRTGYNSRKAPYIILAKGAIHQFIIGVGALDPGPIAETISALLQMTSASITARRAEFERHEMETRRYKVDDKRWEPWVTAPAVTLPRNRTIAPFDASNSVTNGIF